MTRYEKLKDRKHGYSLIPRHLIDRLSQRDITRPTAMNLAVSIADYIGFRPDKGWTCSLSDDQLTEVLGCCLCVAKKSRRDLVANNIIAQRNYEDKDGNRYIGCRQFRYVVDDNSTGPGGE